MHSLPSRSRLKSGCQGGKALEMDFLTVRILSTRESIDLHPTLNQRMSFPYLQSRTLYVTEKMLGLSGRATRYISNGPWLLSKVTCWYACQENWGHVKSTETCAKDQLFRRSLTSS